MRYANISIGGQTRVIRFGLKPLSDCVEHYGDDIESFLKSLEKNPFKSVPLLFYYGLKWGSEEKGEIPDFSHNDVYKWIEGLPGGIQDKVIDQVVRMFIGSVYDNVPTVKEYIDGLPDETKKKLIGV